MNVKVLKLTDPETVRMGKQKQEVCEADQNSTAKVTLFGKNKSVFFKRMHRIDSRALLSESGGGLSIFQWELIQKFYQ